MKKYIDKIGELLAVYSDYSKDTIVFCLKLWIANLFQMFVLVLLSVIFFDVWFSIIFITVFCSLRLMIWGYHCKTFTNCFIVTTLLFLCTGVLSNFALECKFFAYLGMILAAMGMIYLMWVSIKDNACKIKISKKECIFFIIRIMLVLIYGMCSVIMPFCNSFKMCTFAWNILFTYCTVFALTLMRGGEKNETLVD